MKMDPTAKNKGIRHQINKRKAKTKSRNIISKLTYDPMKHKQKHTRKLREDLAKRSLSPPRPQTPITTLTIGAININGLDLEATWAIPQLINNHHLNVSIHFTH